MTQRTALALWLTAPGQAELRPTPYALGAGLIEVQSLHSGISRGTERLVLNGRVPAGEHARMRAPFQEGDFLFPVKYGYCTVGRAESGAAAGRPVFVLHPHQARFAVPEAAAVPLPEGVPAGRAVLAANMETALTVLWDAQVGPGDRVAVIGAGVVGALVGYLCARIPGTAVTLVDVNPARAALAGALGCGFAAPAAVPEEQDVAIHASASAAGLATALACAGTEARVIEASWYGEGTVAAPLGGSFHSRRLQLVASQVGRIPPGRAPRWTYRRRMELALSLLTDPVLDGLISGPTAFADLPARYAAILDDPDTLCHRIDHAV